MAIPQPVEEQKPVPRQTGNRNTAQINSWLWAFPGASDLVPSAAIERHASRKESSKGQPKTWLPSRSIGGPDARIKARIIF
jgi:hypothetical protein